MVFSFLNQLILGQQFKFCSEINKNCKEVYEYVKDTRNWYKLDFHDVIYIQHDLGKDIINTKVGRGILMMETNDQLMQMRYSIDDFTEGKWKFLIRIEPAPKGARLHFAGRSPRGLDSSTVRMRISTFSNQMLRLKEFFSK
jgi:hypothetical protein